MDALREGFRIDWECSEQDHITIQGDFYTGHSKQNVTMTSLTAPHMPSIKDTMKVRGYNMLARWSRKYSEDSDMAVQFYYDRTEQHSSILSETRDTFDLDFQHRFPLADNHSLVWGLGYRHTGDNIDNSYGISFNPTRRNDKLLTSFIQDEITLVEEQLKFIIGSKFEKNDYTGFEYQPSARLLWTPDERNTFWASFTRAVSTPSRFYLHSTNNYLVIDPPGPTPIMAYSFVGNDDLKSQVVKAYELGYRIKPKDNLFFDFSVFYNEYDKLFSVESIDALTQTYNNDMDGKTYGGEIAAHWQVDKNWKLSGGYSFLKMMMNSDTSPSWAKRYTKESPRNMFHINSQMGLQDNLDLDTTVYWVRDPTRGRLWETTNAIATKA